MRLTVHGSLMLYTSLLIRSYTLERGMDMKFEARRQVRICRTGAVDPTRPFDMKCMINTVPLKIKTGIKTLKMVPQIGSKYIIHGKS